MTSDTSAATAEPPAAPPEPQAVASPLTGAAIFLVAVADPGETAQEQVRALCGDLAGLVRAVGFRATDGDFLTCVTGLGDRMWRRLAGESATPAGLHPFTELHADGRHAVATPGDLLFHIRAARMDLCFELASLIAGRLRGAATIADEVHGFRYFDNRDLLGFVDGTENPQGPAADRATLIGAEDPQFAGGSYVIVQKYLHDLDAWNELPVEQQELVIGRRKLSDVELTDAVKPSSAHNALTTITGADGEEIQILRDNMPFGALGSGEVGTYFIGYARSPDPIEQMLRNMFLGSPPGNYDRILDFSQAVTGSLFFVPPAGMLEDLGDGPLDTAPADAAPAPAVPDDQDATGAAATAPDQSDAGLSGSLQIGSMRGASPDE
ncbi:MAG TPA: Dyp-type peroxidase [Streptosporangiaceae bacterium]|nr:Dyp-type peroxidase [Streptosporangiaceae bacterium]